MCGQHHADDLVCDTAMMTAADLRNVSHARQRLRLEANKQEMPHYVPEEEYMFSDHIRGLCVTPGGRLLVAHSVSTPGYT